MNAKHVGHLKFVADVLIRGFITKRRNDTRKLLTRNCVEKIGNI